MRISCGAGGVVILISGSESLNQDHLDPTPGHAFILPGTA